MVNSNLHKYEEIWGPLDEWPQGPHTLKEVVWRLTKIAPDIMRSQTDEFGLHVEMNEPSDLFEAVPAHKWHILVDRWISITAEFDRKLAAVLEPFMRTPVNDQTVISAAWAMRDWRMKNPDDTMAHIASHWFGVDLWMQS